MSPALGPTRTERSAPIISTSLDIWDLRRQKPRGFFPLDGHACAATRDGRRVAEGWLCQRARPDQPSPVGISRPKMATATLSGVGDSISPIVHILIFSRH